MEIGGQYPANDIRADISARMPQMTRVIDGRAATIPGYGPVWSDF